MGQFSIQEKIMSCSEGKKRILESRIRDISLLQAKNGMESRDDSMLTWTHVNRCPQPHPSDIQVAKELLAVHFIHQNTPYQKLTEGVMRLVAQDLVTKHGLHWGDAWRLTRKYIPDMIKLHCLSGGEQIPTFVN